MMENTTINGVVITNKKKKLGLRRDSSFKVINPPSTDHDHITANDPVNVDNVRQRAMAAVDYYNSSVLGGNSSAYKSLNEVYNKEQQHQQQSVIRGKLSKNVSLPLGGGSNQKRASASNLKNSTGGNNATAGNSRFGHPELRASYNERIGRLSYFGGRAASTEVMGPPPPPPPHPSSIYKSNTSLDLDHEVDAISSQNYHPYNGPRSREFGSHGSIDVIARSNSVGHAPFDPYDPPPPPKAMSTLQRTKTVDIVDFESSNNNDDNHSSSSSPKIKKKGFFKSSTQQQRSLFKKLRGGSLKDGDTPDSIDKFVDDRHRRRFFYHYDISSVAASLSFSTLKSLERRNTTTGASAASAALRNGDSMDSSSDADQGDNISNELVLR